PGTLRRVLAAVRAVSAARGGDAGSHHRPRPSRCGTWHRWLARREQTVRARRRTVPGRRPRPRARNPRPRPPCPERNEEGVRSLGGGRVHGRRRGRARPGPRSHPAGVRSSTVRPRAHGRATALLLAAVLATAAAAGCGGDADATEGDADEIGLEARPGLPDDADDDELRAEIEHLLAERDRVVGEIVADPAV